MVIEDKKFFRSTFFLFFFLMGNRTSLHPLHILDLNENIIVRYDGCCRWTVSLTRSEDNTRKDSRFYFWLCNPTLL
jgi:hypothetical protein